MKNFRAVPSFYTVHLTRPKGQVLEYVLVAFLVFLLVLAGRLDRADLARLLGLRVREMFIFLESLHLLFALHSLQHQDDHHHRLLLPWYLLLHHLIFARIQNLQQLS